MSARVFTPAQTAAFATLGRNLLVNAGAGSGKTAVLVERFVTLLARPEDSGIESVGQIVAITFTTKAAQEMRARVRGRLNLELAQAVDDGERTRWARHLNSLDSARISTIHALAAALLRANAPEIEEGLDPAFDVLDEAQAGLLADAAIEDVLRGCDPADPALALFAEYSGDDVLDQLRRSLPQPLPALPEDVLAHWAEAQARQWRQMRPRVLGALREALAWDVPGTLPGSDLRVQAWNTCRALADALEQEPDGWPDHLAQFGGISLRGGSAKVWGEANLAESKQRLTEAKAAANSALGWLGAPADASENGPDSRAAALVRCWHNLLERTQARYRALKQARNAVDFDDLERMALALLEKPAVQARYDGAEFRHVMVDEFQDTSETQWQIIRRLANPARPGALFVVGDPKQSIYGFRGADARVFDRARHEIETHGGAVIPLARSFRTHHQLVNQFNGLFEALFVREAGHPAAAFQTAFSGLDRMDAERQTAADQPPALEFLLADKAGSTGADDTGRAREAAVVAERIRALAAAGRDYGEITLLFRATSGMPVFEQVLKEAGIPYVTVAGRGFFDRQEVWDVLALLRAVTQPDDALNLATALRSPLFGLSDGALLALRLPDALGVRPPLRDRLIEAASGGLAGFPAAEIPVAAHADEVLRDLESAAGRLPLAELIELALARTGYRAVLSALPDGARRRGNLDKLVSKAADASRLSLGAFLQLLGDLTARETRESEAVVDVTGAVRLMTIHAAKGLEFPVVFVVDAAYKAGGGGPLLLLDEELGWAARLRSADPPYLDKENKPLQSFACQWAEAMRDAREDAELRRLLYVALTRAKDHVIVSAPVKLTAKDELGKVGGLLGLLDAHVQFNRHLFGAGVDDAEPALFDGPARMRWQRGVQRRHHAPPLRRWPDAPAPPAEVPALLHTLDAQQWAAARSLSVTRLDELASGRRLNPAAPAPGSAHSARMLGDVVHQALHWCAPGIGEAQLGALLESYLWQKGILPDQGGRRLTGEAMRLLRRALASPLQAEVARAAQVYRELPFVWHSGTRAIHGVIDLLYEDAAGRWTLVDYKTARLADGAFDRHAARYHAQMAVYAAAVRGLLAPPDLAVYIYYIQHDHLLPLAQAELDAALYSLDSLISRLPLEDDLA